MTTRVGLTGGIGAGKSMVSGLLREYGAVVIDADALAREVVEPGTPGLAAVVEAFGPGVLAADGTLDRPALAALVFADPAQRERLNAIVHPLVRARTAALTAAAPPDSVVVNDVPLLVETGLASTYDLVVVVDAPDDVRRQRLLFSRALSADEIERRMAAQASRAERLAAADVVIDNGGTPEQTAGQVRALWERLTGRG